MAGRYWKPDPEWQRLSDEAQSGRGWPKDVPLPRCMRSGSLQALVGREPAGNGADLRWHVSVAHRSRVPTWEEMVEAAHALRPGVVFVIGVPPRSWWMSVHPYVLHLWETRDELLVAEFGQNARGDEPS